MSEQLLTVLKFCLLAVVYLFFFRVLRAVWAEVTPPKPAAAGAPPSGAAPPVAPPRRERRKDRSPPPPSAVPSTPAAASSSGSPTQLVVVEPAARQGTVHVLGGESTVGRAGGCQVRVDDTFASQLHARVYAAQGGYVVEDLGSTNGTFVNGERITAPRVLQRGDRLQVGNTVLELR